MLYGVLIVFILERIVGNTVRAYAAILCVALGIAGCATTGIHTYTEPGDENAAVIESAMIRESTFVWTRLTLLTVDDRFIEMSAWSGLPNDQVRVSPGLLKINVNVTFNHGFGNPQMTTVVPIESNVVRGTRYVLHGRVKGTRVEVWLNDASGRRASNVGSGALGVSAISPVPMIIPMPLLK